MHAAYIRKTAGSILASGTMKKLKTDFDTVVQWYQEYCFELDNNSKDEGYDTERGFAASEISKFLEWILLNKFPKGDYSRFAESIGQFCQKQQLESL